MTDALGPYPAYTASGSPWLGRVPAHWQVRRLRHVAELRVSNVDKHTKPGERPVRLCNYVDVYKNERITDRVPFMRATAGADEVERFRLHPGDVVVTKDSESWTDIGVPALVEYTAPDLVCGYHLAILRPRPDRLTGGFLLRALQSQPLAAQFHVGAVGITRYGLSHADIKDAVLPLPPLAEQALIVRFLADAGAKVGRLMAAKRRLVGLLAEQKQAIIHRAVSGGLAPTADRRPSGAPWLGDIPHGWQVRRISTLFDERVERGRPGLPILSVSLRTGVTRLNEAADARHQKRQIEDQTAYKFTDAGDIVYNTMRMWQGAVGVVPHAGLVSPAYVVARPQSEVVGRFYELVFRLPECKNAINQMSRGIVPDRNRLYWDQFKRLPVPLPPPEVQHTVLKQVAAETATLDAAVQRAERELSLLREYRTTLTAAVVTGQLDVRAVAARLLPAGPPPADPDPPADDPDETDP